MMGGRTTPIAHRGSGGLSPLGLDRLNSQLRRLTVFGGNGTSPVTSGPAGTVMQRRTRPAYAEEGFPYGSIHPFGIVSISDAVVTIAVGGMEVGDSYLESVQTAITLTGLGQYIGLAYSSTLSTLEITGPHDTRPTSSAGVYRTWLYSFDFATGGYATLNRHNLTGMRMGQPW
jgi:hypothetical protein